MSDGADPLGLPCQPPRLSTPHLSPSTQLAVDAATTDRPPHLNLASPDEPTTRSTEPEKGPAEDVAAEAAGSAEDSSHRKGDSHESSNKDATEPAAEEKDDRTAAMAEAECTAEATGAAAAGNTLATPPTAVAPHSSMQEDAGATTTQPNGTAAGLALHYPSALGVPAYDLAGREQWSPLAQEIFKLIHSARGGPKEEHSAHKCRTAFALAREVWTSGPAEVQRRLELGGKGCLAEDHEVNRLSRLPHVNTAALNSNPTAKRRQRIDEAARCILEAALAEDATEKSRDAENTQGSKAKVDNRSSSAKPNLGNHHRPQASPTRGSKAQNLRTPVKSPPYPRVQRTAPASLSPTKRGRRRIFPIQSKRNDGTVEYDEISDASSEDENGPNATEPAKRQALGTRKTAAVAANPATISTDSEGDSAAETSGPERPINTSGLKDAVGPTVPQTTPAPAARTTTSAVVVAEEGELSKEPRATAQTSMGPASPDRGGAPQRRQAAPYAVLQKQITALGQGPMSDDLAAQRRHWNKTAALLQQLLDENHQVKVELEQFKRLYEQEKKASNRRIGELDTKQSAAARSLTQAIEDVRAPNPFHVRPIKGDGHCFFTSVEQAKGWSRGDAKTRIIEYLLSVKGPTEGDLLQLGLTSPEKGLNDSVPASLKGHYITSLMKPDYRGGLVEAHLLVAEQEGRLRIVLIRTAKAPPARSSPTWSFMPVQRQETAASEEVLLYWNKHNGAAEEAIPDHFDLIVGKEEMQQREQTVWKLSPAEATASEDQPFSRWRLAKEACRMWKQQQQLPAALSSPPMPARSTGSAVAAGPAPQATTQDPLVKSYAGAAATHSDTASRVQKPADPEWEQACSSRKNAAKPRVVILGVQEQDMSQTRFRALAAKCKIDLTKVRRVEIQPNDRPAGTNRAILYIDKESDAAAFVQDGTQRAAFVHRQTRWRIRKYQTPRSAPRTAAPHTGQPLPIAPMQYGFDLTVLSVPVHAPRSDSAVTSNPIATSKKAAKASGK